MIIYVVLNLKTFLFYFSESRGITNYIVAYLVAIFQVMIVHEERATQSSSHTLLQNKSYDLYIAISSSTNTYYAD